MTTETSQMDEKTESVIVQQMAEIADTGDEAADSMLNVVQIADQISVNWTHGGGAALVEDLRDRTWVRPGAWDDDRFLNMRWPADLYVPVKADHKPYEAPPRWNLYSERWTNPKGIDPVLVRSDIESGTLWVYSFARPSDSAFTGSMPNNDKFFAEAGLGVMITPQQSAVYVVKPTVRVRGQNRFWVSPNFRDPGGYSSIRERGFVFTAVWELTAGTQLLAHTSVRLFDQRNDTLGLDKINDVEQYLSDARLTLRASLQAGKTYLIGVVALVILDVSVYNFPYPPPPGTWNNWAYLNCTVPKIQVRAY